MVNQSNCLQSVRVVSKGMSQALFSRTTQAYAQHKNVYPCDKQKHHVLIMCHAHYICRACTARRLPLLWRKSESFSQSARQSLSEWAMSPPYSVVQLSVNEPVIESFRTYSASNIAQEAI